MIILTLIIFVIVDILINIIVLKNNNFFKTSFGTCLTLLIALIVSFYLSNKVTDKRRQKEIYINILTKFQTLIEDNSLWDYEKENDLDLIKMKKRKLNNYINTLKKYENIYCVKEEIDFIDNRLSEYIEVVGDHIDDSEYLIKSKKELKRPLDLISQKLDEVMMKMYD